MTVCGYSNWDTFVVSLWADNVESLWNDLWNILQQHGDSPGDAYSLLKDFYQDVVFPVAWVGESEKVDFEAVDWDQIIQENLAQWQAEKAERESAERENLEEGADV